MWIIGCDFHSGFQQVAIFDNQTGEIEEKKLSHPGQATEFYCGLQGEVRVGMESGEESLTHHTSCRAEGLGPTVHRRPRPWLSRRGSATPAPCHAHAEP